MLSLACRTASPAGNRTRKSGARAVHVSLVTWWVQQMVTGAEQPDLCTLWNIYTPCSVLKRSL